MRRRLWPATAVLVATTAMLVAPPATAESAAPEPSSPAGDATVRVEPATGDVYAARAAQIVAGMTPEQRAGAVVMGHIPSRDAETVRAYLADGDLGGFLLMGANVGWEEQVRSLTDAMVVDPALPPLIAVDQEGGSVSRLYWDRAESARTLRDESPGVTEDAFAARGALVARAGIGVNFGIVADVTDDTGSFIWRRVLGETASGATSRVAAAVTGEAPYVLSALKHFPGHGAVREDSHYTVPTTDMSLTQWQSQAARPFSAGISAEAPIVMTGHLAYTAVDERPASLSPEWYRILREDLGFDGVAVTDDLGMLVQSGLPEYADPVRNAVSAIAAGADLVLTVASSTSQTAPDMAAGIAAAVSAGALDEARLTEAATRVVELRLRLAGDGRSLLPCTGECLAPES
ncbi:glycoside hydrolase family 3 N-terminal domain-containing protein [Microbacterium betulae]|uniref:Glycoside hydrolase family 3 N-terminal domain-containing protein n=1 Tax=Microbacterium betulae TaxID=2981139 RepID=A0AA97I773_9MICO|nr:glycoside hydrolase family 3 N-terminal domain-containing protein [Microbacterium sp. AB]WOF24644.1 glycoside hydrolase family 3 N-terminal domain-containing protein [Microbacterium sp. AB]